MRRIPRTAGLLPCVMIAATWLGPWGAPAARAAERWEEMDYGRFLTASITAPKPANNHAMKGIAIRLGADKEAAICFDQDLLRVSAAWTGPFLNLNGTPFDGGHGSWPSVAGEQVLGTQASPGWARGDELEDPRPEPFGTLPANWARYKGLYQSGDRVVLSYTVGDTKVLESPWVEKKDNFVAFTRTFNVEAHDRPLTLVVLDAKIPGEPVEAPADVEPSVAQLGDIFAGLVNAPKGASWKFIDQAILLKLPASPAPTAFRLVFSKLKAGSPEGHPWFTGLIKSVEPASLSLDGLLKGGPAHWTAEITTKGERGKDDGPYAVDTLTAPEENPYKSWLRFGALDFFKDGTRAALTTWSGDVWVVSGIDDGLEKLSWKRFATGLFQPLGLKIVDDQVYVLGREGITILRDLNGDGEADFYEAFNSDVATTTGFHEFAFDLQTDPEGNFYFSKAGPVKGGGRGFERIAANHGAVIKVSKDGKTLANYATGFRAPNGIAVSPTGQVTTGENEGTWTPVCRLNWVKPGGFYGVVDLAHRDQPPTIAEPPICWFPKSIDNSGGGQVWVTSDRWGPFEGRLLHTSYGTCSLFLVMMEEVDGVVQGGVTPLPVNFLTGIMRPKFNAKDGQLYVAGLRGWQTTAARDCAFQRVRRTDKPVNLPTALHVTEEGVDLTFTGPVDKELAADPGNYSVEQWNYLWTSEYGSEEYSAKTHNYEQKVRKLNELRLDPGKNAEAISELTRQLKKGRDRVRVRSAKVSDDGKTVSLEIRGIKPVMQMKIQAALKAADGANLPVEVYNTINIVP